MYLDFDILKKLYMSYTKNKELSHYNFFFEEHRKTLKIGLSFLFTIDSIICNLQKVRRYISAVFDYEIWNLQT